MLGNLSLERPMRKENIFNISMGWGHSSDYRLTDVLAEDEGFEPSIGCPIHAFQACALGRYANPPEEVNSIGGYNYDYARSLVRRYLSLIHI